MLLFELIKAIKHGLLSVNLHGYDVLAIIKIRIIVPTHECFSVHYFKRDQIIGLNSSKARQNSHQYSPRFCQKIFTIGQCQSKINAKQFLDIHDRTIHIKSLLNVFIFIFLTWFL